MSEEKPSIYSPYWADFSVVDSAAYAALKAENERMRKALEFLQWPKNCDCHETAKKGLETNANDQRR